MKRLALILLATCNAAAFAQQAPSVQATLVPPKPLVERRAGIQIVNADILVHNTGPTAMKLAAIREKVFDHAGKLELAREINANGSPPALGAMGDLTIAAGGTADFYQPFERYDADLDLSRVRLELVFLAAGRTVPPVALTGDATAVVEMAPLHFDATPYQLPLAGRLLVHDGHDLASHHRRRNLADAFQRDPRSAINPNLFAYDFVRVDEQANLYRGDVDRKEDWFTFGALIYAPTAGIVVEAVDGVPDNSLSHGQPIVPARARQLDPGGFGNHVAVRGSDGRVSWLLHMESGTIRVRQGQRVAAGTLLGRVGFSGDALFPHLHYTVTASAIYPSQGMPSYFAGFVRILGSRRIAVKRGQIDTGDLVESMARNRLSRTPRRRQPVVGR